MRFAFERQVLDDPKNFTKKGALKKVAAKQLSDVRTPGQPPATPARARTGLDSNGMTSADSQGNVYAIHSGKPQTMRSRRRAMRFGVGGIQPFRSRIQRQTRKQRTGGVR